MAVVLSEIEEDFDLFPRKRRSWRKDWMGRKEFGVQNLLCEELLKTDLGEYRRLLRVSREQFLQVLSRVGPAYERRIRLCAVLYRRKHGCRSHCGTLLQDTGLNNDAAVPVRGRGSGPGPGNLECNHDQGPSRDRETNSSNIPSRYGAYIQMDDSVKAAKGPLAQSKSQHNQGSWAQVASHTAKPNSPKRTPTPITQNPEYLKIVEGNRAFKSSLAELRAEFEAFRRSVAHNNTNARTQAYKDRQVITATTHTQATDDDARPGIPKCTEANR
ncbi:hypothetical protein HPB49_022783 [Dermacentor silvarum]|uniref:Uncharacterized protein n=1 Tax=Dermacentor silvarum TaxID=543639 RepID=A0ACB8D8H0_DERSI|nr:hypothetical protein HPB49_022783 [Dermacentor silvarum]